ncbi:MAG: TatD family hydrolase, partial [Ectothiorhodospiraceae bacterium]
MDLVDIGVNLTSDRFNNDREAVLERAVDAGVRRMLVTGTGVTASREASELAARHPGCLWSTAGIHPHAARDCDDAALAELRTLARDNPGVVAIGETGLDFNRDFSPRADQENAFARQLELATELGLPVFIHERDAHERLSAMLREHVAALPDAVV